MAQTMAGGGRPQPHTPEDTWSRVLDTAIRHFGELPYNRVSVAAIARDAGTSQPNIYTYVASKSELYAATLASSLEHIMGRVSRAAHEADPPDVVTAVHRMLFAEIRRSALVSMAFQDTDPQRFIRLITEPLHQQVRLLLESHLREGQRSGRLRADMDPAATAAGATSLILGAVVAWAHAGRPEADPRDRGVFDVFRQAIAVDLPVPAASG